MRLLNEMENERLMLYEVFCIFIVFCPTVLNPPHQRHTGGLWPQMILLTSERRRGSTLDTNAKREMEVD